MLLTFQQVSAQPKQGLLTGKATLLLLPISEPVVRQQDDQGSHWTLGVLYCHSRQAVYYDSYKPSSGFVIFEKVHVYFTTIRLLSLKRTVSSPENIWQVKQKLKVSHRMISVLGSFFTTLRYVAAVLQLVRANMVFKDPTARQWL